MSNKPNRRTTAPKAPAKAKRIPDDGVVVLSDFKQREREDGALPIVGEDGVTYTIDPPSLWPDAALDLIMTSKVEQACRLIMGDETFDQFVNEGGGSAIIVSTLMQERFGDSLGG